jgi:hypothetical protein
MNRNLFTATFNLESLNKMYTIKDESVFPHTEVLK